MIYEWEQSLDEVNIYINPPPGITAAMLDIEIKATHLMVGIKGNPERYLNVSILPITCNLFLGAPDFFYRGCTAP